jgi:hypothetical protein
MGPRMREDDGCLLGPASEIAEAKTKQASTNVVPAQAGTPAENATSRRTLSMGPRMREDDGSSVRGERYALYRSFFSFFSSFTRSCSSRSRASIVARS